MYLSAGLPWSHRTLRYRSMPVKSTPCMVVGIYTSKQHAKTGHNSSGWAPSKKPQIRNPNPSCSKLTLMMPSGEEETCYMEPSLVSSFRIIPRHYAATWHRPGVGRVRRTEREFVIGESLSDAGGGVSRGLTLKRFIRFWQKCFGLSPSNGARAWTIMPRHHSQAHLS